MRIAINGAGVAGPTLAYWLMRYGHEPVLIEAAPRLRSGGYVIDFWGKGYDIAEKMGLVPRLRELGYQVGEWRLVDSKGRRIGGLNTNAFLEKSLNGRVTSLRRSDLARTIYETIENDVEIIFEDSIASIDEGGGGVNVTFDHAPPRDFDLVVGADGLHSRVRRLAFGPDGGREAFLGYHVAAFDLDGYRPRDELVYITHGVPGRMVSRFSMRGDRTLFLFVFHDEHLRDKHPADDAGRKAALRQVYADVGWEAPDILKRMDAADEIYFDRVSQIRMERWTSGRMALVGDAAACVSLLAGEGTGLAMTEAYVLAGELHRAGGDHATAFERYEQLLMPFLRRKQKSAADFAGAFAPRTAYGLAFRNFVTKLMRLPVLAEWLMGRDLRDDVDLPDYET